MTDLERRDAIRTELVHKRTAATRGVTRGLTWVISAPLGLAASIVLDKLIGNPLPVLFGLFYILGAAVFGSLQVLVSAVERRHATRALERLDREALPPARLLR